MERSVSSSMRLLAVVALVGLASACSTVQARSIHFVDAPSFAATDPASVQILDRPPVRPHWVLGQIMLEPEGNPSQAEIQQKLREEVAQMGGDAAVIVADRLRRVGAVWNGGPWWGGGSIQPVMGQVVSAIAVRFKPL